MGLADLIGDVLDEHILCYEDFQAPSNNNAIKHLTSGTKRRPGSGSPVKRIGTGSISKPSPLALAGFPLPFNEVDSPKRKTKRVIVKSMVVKHPKRRYSASDDSKKVNRSLTSPTLPAVPLHAPATSVRSNAVKQSTEQTPTPPPPSSLRKGALFRAMTNLTLPDAPEITRDALERIKSRSQSPTIDGASMEVHEISSDETVSIDRRSLGKGPKRRGVSWLSSEISALREGVEKFGSTNWEDVLRSSDFRGRDSYVRSSTIGYADLIKQIGPSSEMAKN
jgi:hypothetical protein